MDFWNNTIGGVNEVNSWSNQPIVQQKLFNQEFKPLLQLYDDMCDYSCKMGEFAMQESLLYLIFSCNPDTHKIFPVQSSSRIGAQAEW